CTTTCAARPRCWRPRPCIARMGPWGSPWWASTSRRSARTSRPWWARPCARWAWRSPWRWTGAARRGTRSRTASGPPCTSWAAMGSFATSSLGTTTPSASRRRCARSSRLREAAAHVLDVAVEVVLHLLGHAAGEEGREEAHDPRGLQAALDDDAGVSRGRLGAPGGGVAVLAGEAHLARLGGKLHVQVEGAAAPRVVEPHAVPLPGDDGAMRRRAAGLRARAAQERLAGVVVLAEVGHPGVDRVGAGGDEGLVAPSHAPASGDGAYRHLCDSTYSHGCDEPAGPAHPPPRAGSALPRLRDRGAACGGGRGRGPRDGVPPPRAPGGGGPPRLVRGPGAGPAAARLSPRGARRGDVARGASRGAGPAHGRVPRLAAPRRLGRRRVAPSR